MVTSTTTAAGGDFEQETFCSLPTAVYDVCERGKS